MSSTLPSRAGNRCLVLAIRRRFRDIKWRAANSAVTDSGAEVLAPKIWQLTDVSLCKLQKHLQREMHLLRKGSSMPGTTWSDVKFLTIYEIATMMRISKMSAYRLIHSGELEAIRVGRSYRIPEQAVISYMRDAAFTPTGLAS